MSYAEACPECMARDNEPAALDAYDDETTVASYVCAACGCAWETSWWSAVDPSAAAADSAGQAVNWTGAQQTAAGVLKPTQSHDPAATAPPDGCPRCGIRGAAPTSEDWVDPESVDCTYSCGACGETWTTSWWVGEPWWEWLS